MIAKKDPLCSSVDRSCALLGRAFDEFNALVLCGDFQYDSSFDPQCTSFSCY